MSMFSSVSTEGWRNCRSLYSKPLRISRTLRVWSTEEQTNSRQDSDWNFGHITLAKAADEIRFEP